METGRWFALRGHAAIQGVDLDVDGRAADIMRATRIDADASLAGRSLAALRAFVGDRYAEPREFRVQGHLRSGAGQYALTDARARVGATDLAGDAAWSRSGEPRTVRADLQSKATDVADLEWLLGRTPGTAARAAAAAADASAGTPPGPGGLFAAARELDADIAFDAARFHAAAWPVLQSLKLKAELADDRSPSLASTSAGPTATRPERLPSTCASAPHAPTPARHERRPRRIAARRAADKSRLTGALHGRAALKASGDSAAALLRQRIGHGRSRR